MNYFTSDTHFFHSNIITYCKRPFTSREGDKEVPDAFYMNRELIKRWNDRVKPNDIVYHLGDFSMGPRNLLPTIRKKLNGTIVLIRGNHDRSPATMFEAGIDQVHEDLMMMLDGHTVYMRHKPLGYGEPLKSEFMFCGHIHERWRRIGNMINVGVDVWDYTPRTFEELIAAPEDKDTHRSEENDE